MSRVDSATALLTRERGAGRCEYCHFPEVVAVLPFQMDHIIAQKHGGSSNLSNLAFACYHCNSSKGPNIAGIDPITEEIVRLFHPRQDQWDEHFQWKGAWLFGITSMARATIQVLNMNEPDTVSLRESLMEEGFVFG